MEAVNRGRDDPWVISYSLVVVDDEVIPETEEGKCPHQAMASLVAAFQAAYETLLRRPSFLIHI